MNLCVIPARGGSKRIPRKNIKPFLGRPIIDYSIKSAIESNCFDKVIVSTDDDEIAQIAKNSGADVPFLRPKNLADDFTALIDVVSHSIKWFEKENIFYEYTCCLLPTAPLVSSEILQTAFNNLLSYDSSYCLPINSYPYPVQRALKRNKKGSLEMLFPENQNTRSQDLEEIFHDAGQFYWGKSEAFKDNVPILGEDSVGFAINNLTAYDIDDIEDWHFAEQLYLNSLKKRK